MLQEKLDNLNNPKKAGTERCSICKDLLTNLEQFFNMLDTARKRPTSDWLTVDDIAKELKISKSIVYRIIRKGELEAVDLVETGDKRSIKGHYRVKRSCLNQYLERKKVRPFPNASTRRTHAERVPEVKNHLRL